MRATNNLIGLFQKFSILRVDLIGKKTPQTHFAKTNIILNKGMEHKRNIYQLASGTINYYNHSHSNIFFHISKCHEVLGIKYSNHLFCRM